MQSVNDYLLYFGCIMIKTIRATPRPELPMYFCRFYFSTKGARLTEEKSDIF
jgi:hypothetical protein